MFWAIGCLLAGILAGLALKGILVRLPLGHIVFAAVLALLFIMGAQIGADKEILDNIRNIGIEAFLLTLGAVGGTMLAAWLWAAWLAHRDRPKELCGEKRRRAR